VPAGPPVAAGRLGHQPSAGVLVLHVRTEERFPQGQLADAWDDLVDLDPAGSVFHSARFLRNWCRYLRGECDLRLRFIADGADVIGVVPEVREVLRQEDGDAVRAVHFAGGEHVTDYLGPVGLPSRRDAIVRSWLAQLLDEEDWDVLVAAGLPEDAGWHELLAGELDRHGLAIGGPDVEDVCPRIDLAGGWDGYLGRISGKQRHEIRRKARKLARESDMVKLVVVGVEDLHEAVDRFIALHRTSPGEKGEFFADEHRARFFHALADEFGPDGTLRVDELHVDGRCAATTVSLIHGGERRQREWGLYNSAYDQDFAALAPGMVLVGELVRVAGESRCDVFDLLRGDEPYKYRFGAADRRLRRLTTGRA
jgi:CelD/BcsL family acetyltransferase involved in cellulose biosynthesis